MAQAYRLLCISPSSFATLHDPKSTCISYSSSSFNFKVQNFPYSHKLSSFLPQSKTSLHVSLHEHPLPQPPEQHANSPEVTNSDDTDTKFQSLSKNRIWVNPRSPRAQHLLKKSRSPTATATATSSSPSSSSSSSTLLEIAKSLDSCNEEEVPNVLKSLGDRVLEADAMFILDNMVNPEVALLALEYFKQKVKPSKHVVLYNVTLKVFREVKDFEGAEKLFDEMTQRGVNPSMITFSTMISCAARCSLPHKAVEWFEKMLSFEIEPDNSIWASMIYSYARIGNSDKALSLYDRAKSEKWFVDTATFSALIKMLGMSGNYDRCLSVYNDMKVFGAKPNLVTYNTALYAMGRAKRASQAKVIYEEMVNNGFSPSWATYSALLQAYCRGRFSEDALIIYKEMKEKGMDITRVLYNTVLAMCADVGYTDNAVEILQDMKSSDICQPDNVTFSSMIDMYSCMGKVSEAEAMFKEMLNCGFQLDIYILTSLVQCYGKAKQTDGVVRVFNQFVGLGGIPDDRFCACLLNVMTKTPNEEHGKLIDCVEKANPKLGSVIRSLLGEHKGDEDFRSKASELFNSIDAEVKRSFCNSLIDLCVNFNVQDRASDLLDLGLKLGMYTKIQSKSQTNWYLHLKGLSLGASRTALSCWIKDLSNALDSGEQLPPLLGINTGVGNHKSSDKGGFVRVFESHLKELNAPFHVAPHKVGWFFTTDVAAKSWLQSRGSAEVVAA